MLSFGLIAEGITDFAVLENILFGFFKDSEPKIRELQPLRDATDDAARFGGWVKVFEYCRSSKLLNDLQTSDYLIIQIDTDCCHETGYDVSPLDAQNQKLTPDALAEKVEKQLKSVISAGISVNPLLTESEFWSNYGHRILFAVSVEAIECWLLPLHLENKMQADTNNCLAKLSRKGILLGAKKQRDYNNASAAFAKHKKLMVVYAKNPSLKRFVEQLFKTIQTV
jgi:hypothetical protein